VRFNERLFKPEIDGDIALSKKAGEQIRALSGRLRVRITPNLDRRNGQ